MTCIISLDDELANCTTQTSSSQFENHVVECVTTVVFATPITQSVISKRDFWGMDFVDVHPSMDFRSKFSIITKLINFASGQYRQTYPTKQRNCKWDFRLMFASLSTCKSKTSDCTDVGNVFALSASKFRYMKLSSRSLIMVLGWKRGEGGKSLKKNQNVITRD